MRPLPGNSFLVSHPDQKIFENDENQCQFNKEPNEIIDFFQFSKIYACKNLSILCRVYLLGGITGKFL